MTIKEELLSKYSKYRNDICTTITEFTKDTPIVYASPVNIKYINENMIIESEITCIISGICYTKDKGKINIVDLSMNEIYQLIENIYENIPINKPKFVNPEYD